MTSRDPTVPEPSRPSPLSRLTLLLVGLGALGLAAIPGSGCHGTAPSLLVLVETPSSVEPTQLRFTVNRAGVDPEVIVRPETPAGPLASGQSLRLHLPTETIGSRMGVGVEALSEGAVTAAREAEVEIGDGGETELRIALEPQIEACSPANCDTGCCRDGACVAPGEEPCDSEPEPCAACDPQRSDSCASDICRCGEGPACGESEVCRDGACVIGQWCESEADCGPLPAGGCVENTGTCLDGICETQSKPVGEACESGDRCTEQDTCDGEGACVAGTEVVCAGGSNPCLIYNEVCSPISGCSRPVANGVSCGSPCSGFTCQEGACVQGGFPCGEGQSCCPSHEPRCVDEPPEGHACFTQPT